MDFEVKRFPQWKQLYDAAVPLFEAGMTRFTYDELSSLAGIDIKDFKGRGQFYKFRKALLREKSMWMECEHGKGYVVIQSRDQPAAAFRRVRAAKRKVGMAVAINAYTNVDTMTPEQRCLQAATSAVLHELGKAFISVGRKFSLAAKKAEQRLAVDVDELIRSIEPPKSGTHS